jgi:hypothetical protein
VKNTLKDRLPQNFVTTEFEELLAEKRIEGLLFNKVLTHESFFNFFCRYVLFL